MGLQGPLTHQPVGENVPESGQWPSGVDAAANGETGKDYYIHNIHVYVLHVHAHIHTS